MTSQPFFVPATIILLLSIPLILGLIPRNGVYGVRTARTLSDDRIWYRANRFGGWAFFAASLSYLIVAFLCPTSGRHDPDFLLWLLHLGAFTVPLAAAVLGAVKYAGAL